MAFNGKEVQVFTADKAVSPTNRFPVDADITTGLVQGDYDYIAITYPSATTEQFVFRNGGVSGTIIATVVLTYTDSTKANLSTVVKT